MDQQSAELWPEVTNKKVNLTPHHIPTADYRALTSDTVQRHLKIEGPLAFICVSLLDNRSEFLARLRVRVRHETNHYVIEARRDSSWT